ncbi:PstS family phosphate ABC transporter substrate-binding protein [Collimonas silvisoli]|uniref:PstS family phosphate ABC transporter substrate-binding protein n=1 Tax=Collimonas silvisoli TaxID=2825884 RepID=UPI001B8BC54E|nr:substrate-binding domain-containing protein [Collimonas silvisoli]
MRPYSTAVLGCALSILAGAAQATPVPALAQDEALPEYQAHSVNLPARASYLDEHGAIRIGGAEHAQFIIDRFNALFTSSHPGLRFADHAKGTTATMPLLTYGRMLFGPMGRTANAAELQAYEKAVGAAPVEIRIARTSDDAQQEMSYSIGIYVNRANPIERLSARQVARIFSNGNPEGDLSRWGQLGAGGVWKERAIHPFGTPEFTGMGTYMQSEQLQGRAFTPAYEQWGSTETILKRLEQDPAGIAFAAIGHENATLRQLAIVAADGRTETRGSRPDVASGLYPYGRYVYFYLRREPGQALDPVAKEYLRLVLSRQGQEIIASQAGGYIPLSAAEVRAELRKLDELAEDANANAVGRHQSGLSLAGADDMADLLRQLNAMHSRTYPAAHIEMALKGSSTGLPALTAGAASVAVVTHEASPAEIAAFRQVWGYPPFLIRIGYTGFGQRSPAVYVNRRNPLPSLNMQQLTQIFTAGAAAGNLNFWSQLGLKDGWQQRRIHLYGLRDDGGSATVLRSAHLGKLPFAAHYEALGSPQAILTAVADDPYGIALLGPADVAPLPAALRILPLAPAEGSAAVTPSRENVAAGSYPLSVYVQLYINRAPGQALDEALRNYLKTALSAAGQRAIAADRRHLPLSADDLTAERKKLD